VVRDVLDAAGLYPGEACSPPPAERDVPAPREYCVQAAESDLDFVRRLLAEEGILFTFGAGGTDTVELFDARSASGRPRVPAAAAGPLPLHGGGDATASGEGLRRLDVTAAVTTRSVALRDHDFSHPQVPLGAGEPRAGGSVERYPARFVLGAYDEGAHRYGSPNAQRTARVALQEHVAAAAGARGEGDVTGMRAGDTFAVTEAGERALEGTFLVTAVLHVGHAPDVSLADGGASGLDRYRNRFECVPVAHAWAPPAPPRPRAEHAQVAVVTAEPGSDEEICTDFYGRVLVRFPWDRPERRRAPQDSKRSSCWLRVMQPWAGAHWGFHFTPRVGMEVIVHFVDGDPDRPYVAGCLPNAVNVPPVELPLHKTQSAIRTRSSPRAEGYNELRFEDLAGSEEVYVRAQRDQRVEVLHDRALTVGRDARAEVMRDESRFVGRDHTVDVGGHETHSVERDRTLSVTGNNTHDVGGHHTLTVHASLTVHADERGRVSTADGLVLEVGGGSGTATTMTPDDVTTSAPKHHRVKVGDEAAAEMSAERYALKVPKGVSLLCGETRIEMGEDKIVLQTQGGAKIELQGDKVTVKTSGAVSLQGSQITQN